MFEFLNRKSSKGKSKFKEGAILIAGGYIAIAVGKYLNGDIADVVELLKELYIPAGALLAALGFRDLPFVNKK